MRQCSTSQHCFVWTSWGLEIINWIEPPLCSVCLAVESRVFLLLEYDFPPTRLDFNNFILVPPNAKFSITKF